MNIMNIKDKKLKLIIFAAVMITVSFGFGKEILAAPSWTFGIVPQSGGKLGGGALEFDGDDYVDIGNVGNVQAVEFWLNDSNTADGILELINNSTYVSISGGAITATGFTSPTIYVNGSSASASLATGWNHVVITNTASVAAASFQIGEANGDHMSGIIDEVAIYNRALSIEEVRYHYNKGGPVAHWKFDEGSGSTAYDSTVNNNDGTISGAVYATGKYNSALSFDGLDDYVQATVTQDKTTYSLWIKPATTGVWEHVVKIGSVYYVNTVQGTPTAFPIYVSGNTVQVGKTGASAYFYGLIDDVRIYNYARTLEEIKLDYNAGFKAIF